MAPRDLSQSLRIPGQVGDGRVLELMEKAVKISRNSGKIVVTFAATPETARKWIDAGVQYIGIGVDVMIFRNACEALVKAINL